MRNLDPQVVRGCSQQDSLHDAAADDDDLQYRPEVTGKQVGTTLLSVNGVRVTDSSLHIWRWTHAELRRCHWLQRTQ